MMHRMRVFLFVVNYFLIAGTTLTPLAFAQSADDLRPQVNADIQQVLDAANGDTPLGALLRQKYEYQLAQFKKIQAILFSTPFVSASDKTSGCTVDKKDAVEAFWNTGTRVITLCPNLGEQSKSEQILTLIHELTHAVGELSESKATTTEIMVELIRSYPPDQTAYLLDKRNTDLRKKFIELNNFIFHKKEIPEQTSIEAPQNITIEFDPLFWQKILALKEGQSLHFMPDVDADPTNLLFYCGAIKSGPNYFGTLSTTESIDPHLTTYHLNSVHSTFIPVFQQKNITGYRLMLFLNGSEFSLQIECDQVQPGPITEEDLSGVLLHPKIY
jgi:hypothetical protein